MDSVRTENVSLQVADGTMMNAFVATPEDGGKLPCLLVFQEAFGVNPHIRDVTQRFAKQGYVAIAPELFHRTGPGFEGTYNNFPACMPHMQALTPEGGDFVLRRRYCSRSLTSRAANSRADALLLGRPGQSYPARPNSFRNRRDERSKENLR